MLNSIFVFPFFILHGAPCLEIAQFHSIWIHVLQQCYRSFCLFVFFLETYCIKDCTYLIFKRRLGRLVGGLLWRLKGKENELSNLEFHLPAHGGNAWNGTGFRVGRSVLRAHLCRRNQCFEPEWWYSEMHTFESSGTSFLVEWFLYWVNSLSLSQDGGKRYLKRAPFSLRWDQSLKCLLSQFSVMFLLTIHTGFNLTVLFWLMDCSLLSRKAKIFVLTACQIQLQEAFFSCLGVLF